MVQSRKQDPWRQWVVLALGCLESSERTPVSLAVAPEEEWTAPLSVQPVWMGPLLCVGTMLERRVGGLALNDVTAVLWGPLGKRRRQTPA